MRQGQQNWDYNHVEGAWPIVNAFLPLDKELNDTPLLKQKLSVLQDVECNNHLRGGIVNVYNQYDESWLIAMNKMGYKYACLWFEGCWPDTLDFNNQLLDEIDGYNCSPCDSFLLFLCCYFEINIHYKSKNWNNQPIHVTYLYNHPKRGYNNNKALFFSTSKSHFSYVSYVK